MIRSKEELSEFIREKRKPEHTAGMPLNGIRVLDISTLIAAPYASMLLGDAGAEIIKVENSNVPDGLRTWGVIKESGIAPYHSVLGRNKLPVTIDLKSEIGKKLFFELVRRSDVLIENMRVGVMDRLGLSHARILEENRNIVIGKISGYGMTGPNSKQPGFGTLAEGFCGFSYLNGYPDGGPTSPPLALADFTSGAHLAYAIVLALFSVQRGQAVGQVIDMSLYEPLFGYLGSEFLSYFMTGAIPQRIGNEFKAAAPRNNFKTRDGHWIALSCTDQGPWEKLAIVMGREELIDHEDYKTNNDRTKPENRRRLNDIIQQWFSGMEKETALDIFRREGITAGPIYNMKDIAADEHYRARGSIAEIEDPPTGIKMNMPNVSFRFLGRPGKIRFAGLPYGSANDVVFGDLLGYSKEAIEAWAAKS